MVYEGSQQIKNLSFSVQEVLKYKTETENLCVIKTVRLRKERKSREKEAEIAGAKVIPNETRGFSTRNRFM